MSPRRRSSRVPGVVRPQQAGAQGQDRHQDGYYDDRHGAQHYDGGHDDEHARGRLMVYTTLPRPASSATTSVPRRPVASPAWRHVDVLLIAATAAISALGVLMVYSTTRTPLAVAGDNPQATMKKQAVYAVAGLVAFVVTVFFDYKRYLSWAPVLYVGSLLLLMATLVVGRAELGATSWIQVGSIQVEPSEIVKVGLVLSLAALLANRKGAISGRVLLAVLGLSVLPFLLIYKQDALAAPWCWPSSWSGCS